MKSRTNQLKRKIFLKKFISSKAMEGHGDRIEEEETLRRRTSGALSLMQTHEDRIRDRREHEDDGEEKSSQDNYRLVDTYGFRRATISQERFRQLKGWSGCGTCHGRSRIPRWHKNFTELPRNLACAKSRGNDIQTDASFGLETPHFIKIWRVYPMRRG